MIPGTGAGLVRVIAGSGTLEAERGATPFSAGSVFRFPPGAWHAAFETEPIETNVARWEPPAISR